ncbi:hypothetical protein PIIN_10906 [Serendipita indica DSM 11827]|uniref:Uncharacterized protein n=1 Tax=Serendipita indica (strain DSM 11827) TaxID=1109443 RepID=G4U030_SERID|nr:hypothetical protein PIIN_10906 [Serendipita indica DSM 11827]
MCHSQPSMHPFCDHPSHELLQCCPNRLSNFNRVSAGTYSTVGAIGEELSVADLEALITKVVRAADKIGAGHAVGALTGDNKTGGGRLGS